jgi:hypothetical protein
MGRRFLLERRSNMEVARRTYSAWKGLKGTRKLKDRKTPPHQQLVVYGAPAQVGGTLQMRFNFEDLDEAEAMARDLLEAIAEWRTEVSKP